MFAVWGPRPQDMTLNPESQHAQVMQKIATEAIMVFDAAEDICALRHVELRVSG